jgi:hypothetical protein
MRASVYGFGIAAARSSPLVRAFLASSVLPSRISAIPSILRDCVGTCLGHYISMPNGPPRRLIENWDHLLAGGKVELYGYPCGLDYFKDFIGDAPIYHLAEVRCPVFFLEGGSDNPFRRTDGHLGYEVMRRAELSTAFLEISDGMHGMTLRPIALLPSAPSSPTWQTPSRAWTSR